ncbi:MAG: sterol desaturase family protein [Candidatus Binatia bacterium]
MNREFFPLYAFLSCAALFTATEMIRPARWISYRAVIKDDLIALALYELLFFPASIAVTQMLIRPHHLPKAIMELPFLIRLGLFYVVADFGTYWLHRLMHTKFVWRIHKWHHSPTYMYWLAGIRATLPQQILFNLPFALCWPFLKLAPSWALLFVLFENFFRNDWMHMNVTWRSNWLEWVLVTPRYHHIHHSDDPSHYKANLGSLLTIWDRMFGTYVNPEEVKKEVTFGMGEQVSPIRLILGF